VTIPAGHGKAARLAAGQKIKLVNSHGTQVVDCWAFNAYDLGEYMSMESSRVWNLRLNPKLGDVFVTTQRRPILTLVEDTTMGIHDTLLAACDRYRYELLGCIEYHDNCTDNLAAALAELGLQSAETPSPWNLFMNIPVGSDGTLTFKPPVSQAGDHVLLRAEIECVVAFSACPQDLVPINGLNSVCKLCLRRC